MASINDELKAQITAGKIIFDAGAEDKLTKQLLQENPEATKVTVKLQQLVLELSKVIDAGKQIRISSLIRNEGHHATGRAVDLGNEEIAPHLLGEKQIATAAKVASLSIDEIIFKADGATLALQNRWNYDLCAKHDYDAATLAQHSDHIHFAVTA